METDAVEPRQRFFAFEDLSQIVDRKLERAAEQVCAASRAPADARAQEMNFARAEYGVAFAIAALADESVFNCNEWPRFEEWAAALTMDAASLKASAR